MSAASPLHPALPAQWPAVQALLFDLDGTLIDSMPLHHDAWRQWFVQQGLPFDEDGFFAATAGRTNGEILADLFPQRSAADRLAMAQAKEALYQSAARQRLALVPGTQHLMDAAVARGLKLAVCTAAPDDNVAVAYQRFGLDRLLATTVNPDQGFRGKPHPDLFLEAARRLGVPAAACVVFEDAPLGIEAARRAGMRAVALTTSAPSSAFAAFDNLAGCVPDFTTFDLGALLAG